MNQDLKLLSENYTCNVITGKWNIHIPTGRIQLDNDWLTMLEYSDEAGDTDFNMWLDRLHPDDVSSAVSAYLKYLRGETPDYHDEFRIMTGRGSWKWVMTRGWITERDNSGNPLIISGIHVDIDRTKKREANLLQVQKIASIGTWTYAAEQDILTCSEECKNIFRADELGENFRYTDFLMVLHPESKPAVEEHYNKLSSNSQISDMLEIRLLFPDNETKHVFVSYRTEKNNDNNVIITGLVQDITAKKNYENMLIKARIKAEESEKLKSAFLANMSHEIRTPLNSIIGFSRILSEEKLSRKEKEEYHSIIQSNTEQLLNLVNDILDSAKIENGEFEIFNELFSVNELIQEAYNVFQKRIKTLGKMKLHFYSDIPEESGNIFLLSDRNRLMQVFNNLISNAIKFTNSGKIVFGYKIIDNEKLLLFVEDTGDGINKDNLEIIFDRFRQEDQSMTRRHDGAGLGLNIVRNILKILGTDISVESEKGKGSRFYFPIEYRIIETGIKKKKILKNKVDLSTRDELKNKKVLIVDDHELSYKFTSALLQKAGLNTVYAGSGEEALKILADKSGIDLVLLDIQMPGMDGLEVLSRIRDKKINTPVIAQTAHALSGDREKYLGSGFNDYLSKPIDRNELISKIVSFLIRK